MSNSFHGWIWYLHHNGLGLITLSSFILLITFLAILDFIDGVHISSRQSNAACIYLYLYIHINIYLHICLWRVTHEYPWSSPHFMRWKLAHPRWGSNPRSLDYIPSSITRHVWDHQARHLKYISIYQGLQTKKFCKKMTKNMNWICPMMAILNFSICGKTVSFTAWHTAEMDSAQNFHIETTNEVLFLKNAYRSLSRALFQFFVLTIYANMNIRLVAS